MMSQSLPAGSVKEQLEALISQLGFEAHKAEAVLADNNDQEKKRIDEYYDNVQSRLNKEKDEFQNAI